jgi:DNA-binding MarR family transcriptional regulator
MSPPRGVRVSAGFVSEHPGADPSATELVINLLVTAGLLEHHLERVLRRHGLTLGSFKVLQVVAGAEEPVTPSQIRDRIDTPVTTATVTGVLDTLEKAGLLRRGPHPTDRRRVLVALTGDGRRLLDAVVPAVLAGEREWTAPLSRRQRAEVVDRLGALQDGLRALPAD